MGPAARGALLLLAFTPALAGAVLVAENAVDVPIAEDWARAELLEPGVAVADFAFHAPIPRLVARVNMTVSNGDLTVEMALGCGLLLVTALCVHGLLRRTFRDHHGALMGTTFLANLLLFSPMQWENLLWAARWWSFLPMAALSAGLLALGSRWPGVLKLAACALLAAIAAAASPLSALFATPDERAGLPAFLGMLGSPFARTSLLPVQDLAPAVGALVVAFFGVGAGYAGLRWRDPDLRERSLPWLILAGLSLAVCLLMLRSLESRDALLPRYAGFSLYVCLAAVPLAVLASADLRQRLPAGWPALRVALEWAPAFVAGILCVAIGLGWLVGIQGMQEWKSARLQARTSLVFLERFDPSHPVRLGGEAGLEDLRRAAGVLDRHGQLHPPLAAGAGIEPFRLDDPLAPEWGDLESAWVSVEHLDLAGFAWLAGPGRRADGVLVTARIGVEPARVIAVAELQGMPLPPIPQHDHIYNDARIPGIDERATWHVRVPARALPQAARLHLEAFAVDSESLRLHRLEREVLLQRDASGLSATLVQRDTR